VESIANKYIKQYYREKIKGYIESGKNTPNSVCTVLEIEKTNDSLYHAVYTSVYGRGYSVESFLNFIRENPGGTATANPFGTNIVLLSPAFAVLQQTDSTYARADINGDQEISAVVTFKEGEITTCSGNAKTVNDAVILASKTQIAWFIKNLRNIVGTRLTLDIFNECIQKEFEEFKKHIKDKKTSNKLNRVLDPNDKYFNTVFYKFFETQSVESILQFDVVAEMARFKTAISGFIKGNAKACGLEYMLLNTLISGNVAQVGIFDLKGILSNSNGTNYKDDNYIVLGNKLYRQLKRIKVPLDLVNHILVKQDDNFYYHAIIKQPMEGASKERASSILGLSTDSIVIYDNLLIQTAGFKAVATEAAGTDYTEASLRGVDTYLSAGAGGAPPLVRNPAAAAAAAADAAIVTKARAAADKKREELKNPNQIIYDLAAGGTTNLAIAGDKTGFGALYRFNIN
jgi:hypothetical protein